MSNTFNTSTAPDAPNIYGTSNAGAPTGPSDWNDDWLSAYVSRGQEAMPQEDPHTVIGEARDFVKEPEMPSDHRRTAMCNRLTAILNINRGTAEQRLILEFLIDCIWARYHINGIPELYQGTHLYAGWGHSATLSGLPEAQTELKAAMRQWEIPESFPSVWPGLLVVREPLVL